MTRVQPAVHAVALHPDGTVLNGDRWAELPPGALDSLPGLLARVSPLFKLGGQGVIVLTEAAARQLGYPAELPRTAAEAKDHPVLTAPRAAGWRVTGLSGWQTFWQDTRPSVHVAVHPWLDGKTGPLLDSDPWEMAWHLHRYAELTGSAYHATPGVTGIGLLRDSYPGRTQPYWTPPTKGLPAGSRAAEADIVWVRSEPATGNLHTYDANLMYLSAAGSAHLAVNELRHTPRARPAGPELAGYWRIEQPTWHEPRLPSPLGWRRKGRGEPIWITTPTLLLLAELAELKRPMVSAPVVVDAWTSPGHRIMRSWAQILTGAAATARAGAEHEPDQCRCSCDARQLQAVKATYRETVGMLNRADSRVHRPDWRHAVIATARANLWRKMWRIASVEDRWPASVRVDAITYPSDKPDAVAACPAGLTLGTAAGQFKVQTRTKS